jgi:hypothetical protein
MSQTEKQRPRSIEELEHYNNKTATALKDAVFDLKLALDRGYMSARFACSKLDTPEHTFTLDDLNALFVMFGQRGTGL